jgi:DNA-binding XRE family transcriptional regulator
MNGTNGMDNRVRELREANTWSIAKLAREAGVTDQTISKMEKNQRTTRVSKLKVAKAFGVKLHEVFPGEGA